MKRNVGKLDRYIRILMGLTMIVGGSFLYKLIPWWAFIGLIPLMTGTLQWCPFYKLFGLNTASDADSACACSCSCEEGTDKAEVK